MVMLIRHLSTGNESSSLPNKKLTAQEPSTCPTLHSVGAAAGLAQDRVGETASAAQSPHAAETRTCPSPQPQRPGSPTDRDPRTPLC